MNDAPDIPVLTDIVTDPETSDQTPASDSPAASIDPAVREAIAAELRDFMHGTLRNQMTNAMEEVIDDLCNQANDKLEALLDKHLGK